MKVSVKRPGRSRGSSFPGTQLLTKTSSVLDMPSVDPTVRITSGPPAYGTLGCRCSRANWRTKESSGGYPLAWPYCSAVARSIRSKGFGVVESWGTTRCAAAAASVAAADFEGEMVALASCESREPAPLLLLASGFEASSSDRGAHRSGLAVCASRVSKGK